MVAGAGLDEPRQLDTGKPLARHLGADVIEHERVAGREALLLRAHLSVAIDIEAGAAHVVVGLGRSSLDELDASIASQDPSVGSPAFEHATTTAPSGTLLKTESMNWAFVTAVRPAMSSRLSARSSVRSAGLDGAPSESEPGVTRIASLLGRLGGLRYEGMTEVRRIGEPRRAVDVVSEQASMQRRPMLLLGK